MEGGATSATQAATSAAQAATSAAQAATSVAEANKNSQENELPFDLQFGLRARDVLSQLNISIAVSSYKSNLLFTLGCAGDGRPGLWYARYPQPMGIAHKDNKVYVACESHIIECVNRGESRDLDISDSYVPRVMHITGDQHIHDLFFVDGGYSNIHNDLVYVSTRYSCVGIVANEQDDFSDSNLDVLWKPPFISAVKGEDRCHLNGGCLQPDTECDMYLTSTSTNDTHDGWRDHRVGGGVVMDTSRDTDNDEEAIVCRGLSMPHSPRMHQGKLWLLQSGTGELGTVDLDTGKFVPRVFIPGFLRGLAFKGKYAFVGSSLPRDERRFSGLPLDTILKNKDTTPVCGVFIIDIESDTIVDKIVFTRGVVELYDVCVIPGRRAALFGPLDTQIKQVYIKNDMY